MIPDQYYRSPIVQAMLERATNPNIGPVYSIGHGLALAGTQILNAVMANQYAKEAQKKDEANTNAILDAVMQFNGGSGTSEDVAKALELQNNEKQSSDKETPAPVTPAPPVQPLKTGDVKDYLSTPASVSVGAEGQVVSGLTPTSQSIGRGRPDIASADLAANYSFTPPSAEQLSAQQPSKRLADVTQRAVPVTPPLPTPPLVTPFGENPSALDFSSSRMSVGQDGTLTPATPSAVGQPPALGAGVASASDLRTPSPLVDATTNPKPTPQDMFSAATRNNPAFGRYAELANVVRQMPQSEFKRQAAQTLLSSLFENTLTQPKTSEQYVTLTPEQFQEMTGQDLPPEIVAQLNTSNNQLSFYRMNPRPMVDISNTVNADQQPGSWDKLDDQVGQKLGEWALGENVAAFSNLQKLVEGITMLENIPGITGPGKGLIPDNLESTFAPQMATARQRIQSTIQDTLRQINGSQFTQAEAQRVLNYVFDPSVSNTENIKRAKALFEFMHQQAQNKEDMLQYFQDKGTIRGFKSRLSFGTASADVYLDAMRQESDGSASDSDEPGEFIYDPATKTVRKNKP